MIAKKNGKQVISFEHDILYVRVESEKEITGVNSLFKLKRVIQAANTKYSSERVYTECHS